MAEADIAVVRIVPETSFKNKAYEALKEAILKMDIYATPDPVMLDERALSERLGVSRTPIREAIAMLEQDGFVKTVPRRGIVVVRRTKSEIVDMIRAWAALESMAARLITTTRAQEGHFGAARLLQEFWQGPSAAGPRRGIFQSQYRLSPGADSLSESPALVDMTNDILLHVRGVPAVDDRRVDRIAASLPEHLADHRSTRTARYRACGSLHETTHSALPLSSKRMARNSSAPITWLLLYQSGRTRPIKKPSGRSGMSAAVQSIDTNGWRRAGADRWLEPYHRCVEADGLTTIYGVPGIPLPTSAAWRRPRALGHLIVTSRTPATRRRSRDPDEEARRSPTVSAPAFSMASPRCPCHHRSPPDDPDLGLIGALKSSTCSRATMKRWTSSAIAKPLCKAASARRTPPISASDLRARSAPQCRDVRAASISIRPPSFRPGDERRGWRNRWSR